jgi:16S rRNA (guanine1516-N2)-methyltransferase
MTLPSDLAVSCVGPELLAQAEELAACLDLPLAKPDARHSLLLRVSHAGLELRKPDDPHMTGSVRVDFTSGAVDFRRRQTGKELLLKAVGCKGSFRPAVIDATGGLGRDSFLLAAAGCQVHLFEREPVIAALLADGIERARRHPETAAIAARMHLTVGDALPFFREMRQQGQFIDAVYLDPMFPERRKSALVKKELQFLQLLADSNPAAEQQLLSAARAVSHRVAVKRPAKASFLANQPPSHSLTGATVRFDVYLSLPDRSR